MAYLAARPASAASQVGLTNSAFRTLSPVYAEQIGLSVTNMRHLRQRQHRWRRHHSVPARVPLGYLGSPHGPAVNDRGRIALRARLVFLAGNSALANFVLVFIFGSFAMPLFSLSAAHANDRAGKGEFVLVNAALMLFYSFGAVVGPLAAAYFMQGFGPTVALPFLRGVYTIFIPITLYRVEPRRACRKEGGGISPRCSGHRRYLPNWPGATAAKRTEERARPAGPGWLLAVNLQRVANFIDLAKAVVADAEHILGPVHDVVIDIVVAILRDPVPVGRIHQCIAQRLIDFLVGEFVIGRGHDERANARHSRIVGIQIGVIVALQRIEPGQPRVKGFLLWLWHHYRIGERGQFDLATLLLCGFRYPGVGGLLCLPAVRRVADDRPELARMTGPDAHAAGLATSPGVT